MSIRNIIVQGSPVVREALANAAISPGHLVEFVPNQTDRRLRVHATDEGPAIPRFALENHTFGKDIDDDYASGELVRYATFQRGDVVLARIKANVALEQGDKLGSNANGQLDALAIAAGTLEGAFVGEAFENVAASAGGKMLKVEIA